jgi:hypothetical protein
VKEIAGLAQVKLRGLARVDCAFVLSLAAYNLVRLPKLLAEVSPERPDGGAGWSAAVGSSRPTSESVPAAYGAMGEGVARELRFGPPRHPANC